MLKQIAIRIDQAWARHIKTEAAQQGISQQALIEAALQAYKPTRFPTNGRPEADRSRV